MLDLIRKREILKRDLSVSLVHLSRTHLHLVRQLIQHLEEDQVDREELDSLFHVYFGPVVGEEPINQEEPPAKKQKIVQPQRKTTATSKKTASATRTLLRPSTRKSTTKKTTKTTRKATTTAVILRPHYNKRNKHGQFTKRKQHNGKAVQTMISGAHHVKFSFASSFRTLHYNSLSLFTQITFLMTIFFANKHSINNKNKKQKKKQPCSRNGSGDRQFHQLAP